MGWVGVWCVGGGRVGCWRVHGEGACTHPPMNSYNVKIFNFINTHPPTHQTYPKCHSVIIHILWRAHGVGGGWRVHGMGGGRMGGWRVSWGGLVCVGVGGGGVHGGVVGWRVHGRVSVCTHPTQECWV